MKKACAILLSLSIFLSACAGPAGAAEPAGAGGTTGSAEPAGSAGTAADPEHANVSQDAEQPESQNEKPDLVLMRQEKQDYSRAAQNKKNTAGDQKASTLKPAITVIYLGTNDFSTRMQPAERVFTAAYITLLKKIKELHGDSHPILCVAPKHDILQLEYIQKAAQTSGLQGIHVMALGPSVHNEISDMGADGHPNYSGHLKIAHSVIPYISTITGWEMNPDNKIK